LNGAKKTLAEMSDDVIARHLTLIEFDLFRRIGPHELLHQSWNKVR
jgi:hypothetical protein